MLTPGTPKLPQKWQRQAGGWEAACHEKLTLALLLLDGMRTSDCGLRITSDTATVIQLLQLWEDKEPIRHEQTPLRPAAFAVKKALKKLVRGAPGQRSRG